MLSAQQYIKYLSGVMLAILFIWIGITGRLGSLMGAIITPGYMTNGTSGMGTPSSNTVPGGVLPKQTNNNTVLTMGQIAFYAYAAGLTTLQPLAIATAVAMAESGGRVGAQNPSGAAGLWQILPSAHPSYNVQQLLSDASYNASAMYAISSSGSNWNPWTTYTNGSYQQYMSQATSAANIAIAANGGAKQK